MRYFVLFFGLLSLLGCSNRGNDNAIYGSFLVRYMEQGNQIKATASFFEGDTLRTARPKAWEGGVSFLGSAMKMRNMVDSEFRYTSERNIDFLNEYTFRFNDERGQPQEVDIRMEAAKSPSFKSPASKSSGLVLSYEGSPLQAGESMVVLLTDEQNQTYSFMVQGPQNSQTVILSSRDVVSLPEGKLMMYLVRSQKKEMSKGRFDYAVDMEYYSATTTVEILP
jgi:hypothetical protein